MDLHQRHRVLFRCARRPAGGAAGGRVGGYPGPTLTGELPGLLAPAQRALRFTTAALAAALALASMLTLADPTAGAGLLDVAIAAMLGAAWRASHLVTRAMRTLSPNAADA